MMHGINMNKFYLLVCPRYSVVKDHNHAQHQICELDESGVYFCLLVNVYEVFEPTFCVFRQCHG
jgi:hypothetical protein